MTSDSGNKVNSYDYDIYGVMLNQVEKTGVNNPFKFADGYLDASGYYLFGVRYYDPSLGRWTQQDPVGGSLGDLNSGNRYTYVEDDPVNLVDPSGKDCVSDILGNTLLLIAAGLGFAYSNIALVEAVIAEAALEPPIFAFIISFIGGLGAVFVLYNVLTTCF